MSAGGAILLGAFRTEDRDRDRSSLREIIAVDPRADLVAQPDGFGALRKTALRALLDQREAAAALLEEIGRAGTVGQHRRCARQEHEARLLIAGGRGLRADAGDVAQ